MVKTATKTNRVGEGRGRGKEKGLIFSLTIPRSQSIPEGEQSRSLEPRNEAEAAEEEALQAPVGPPF